ncbi:hypothetical protein DFO58_3283 [Arthrobacter sp. AG1021]|uniref:hypothetical protein n=1 Tax=Arthrobacter sp. AG1021 TaxID=2183908 RepID=UPI000EAE76C8|nr:hypothetical protein [Arthrobacter sp. AG1021]RKS16726.1 hypothetical protein DFO58_3283 [Arthrobacter sp. AG1021]
MKPGIINLAKLNQSQRDVLFEWATANGVRHYVPLESRMVITGNKFIVETFDIERIGQKNMKWARRFGSRNMPRRTRTYRIRVPLRAPERGPAVGAQWEDEINA